MRGGRAVDWPGKGLPSPHHNGSGWGIAGGMFVCGYLSCFLIDCQTLRYALWCKTNKREWAIRGDAADAAGDKVDLQEETSLLQGAGSSHQSRKRELERKSSSFPYLIWVLSLLICALAMAMAFVYFDVPIARRVYGILGSAESLATGFASAVLLGFEGSVALVLVIIRIARGHLSPFRETIALACLTSICAYAINDNTLKLFFGVPNPAAVLHGAPHAFNLLSGSSRSSFPSGHMVMAGAFAGVFMRLYRTSILPFSVLLFVAAVLLIAGDWHFVSDVIAGTFVGISAGLLAGEVWLAHSK
jgi:membrane-associated phospholipid phosphatase